MLIRKAFLENLRSLKSNNLVVYFALGIALEILNQESPNKTILQFRYCLSILDNVMCSKVSVAGELVLAQVSLKSPANFTVTDSPSGRVCKSLKVVNISSLQMM
jgi:hypothetical protein